MRVTDVIVSCIGAHAWLFDYQVRIMLFYVQNDTSKYDYYLVNRMLIHYNIIYLVDRLWVDLILHTFQVLYVTFFVIDVRFSRGIEFSFSCFSENLSAK